MSFEKLFDEVLEAATLAELEAITERLTGATERETTVRCLIDTQRKFLENAAVIREQKAVLERWTVFAALTYGERLRDWTFRGKEQSSTHAKANSTEKSLNLVAISEDTEIVRGSNGKPFDELLRTVPASFNVDRFDGADLQENVHSILKDAVEIVNIMLGLSAEEDCFLYVRREANIFTNRPDHSVVYLHGREVPIVTIQAKPGDTAMDDPHVFGQKFDQLLGSILLAQNANAIGAITSLSKTRIAWVGQEADELMQAGGLLSLENLKLCHEQCMKRKEKIAGGTLDPKDTQVASDHNQNSLPISSTSDNRTVYERPSKKRRETPNRKLFVSQRFEVTEIVAAFCNLIIAGIVLSKGEPKHFTLPINERLDVPACVALTSNGGKGNLPAIQPLSTRIEGPATEQKQCWFGFWSKKHYYLIARKEVGLHYNIFRAITEDGFECVVKMYVQEYDSDENWKKIETFDEDGRKAVKEEEKMYHTIYPELKPHVWTEKLCGRHCLIVPFFDEVPKAERDDYGPKVAARYFTEFVQKGCGITEDRIAWQHIGIFNEQVYLYSLSNVTMKLNETDIKSKEDFLDTLSSVQ